MKTKRIRIAAMACGVSLTLASAAVAYPGYAEYGKLAKIDLKTAEAIALKAFPGKIVSYELEKETGGSGLRYSFVIANSASKHELGVDAATGKILQNAEEGESPD